MFKHLVHTGKLLANSESDLTIAIIRDNIQKKLDSLSDRRPTNGVTNEYCTCLLLLFKIGFFQTCCVILHVNIGGCFSW